MNKGQYPNGVRHLIGGPAHGQVVLYNRSEGPPGRWYVAPSIESHYQRNPATVPMDAMMYPWEYILVSYGGTEFYAFNGRKGEHSNG